MSAEDQPNEQIIQIERIIGVFERGVAALESVAHSFAGINISIQKIQRRYAPDPRRQEDVREAVVTRVPTEEDLAKEAQGASDKPIREWFNLEDPEEPEEIGPREKEFLEKQRAKAGKESRPRSGRLEETGRKRN
jgi:hypothetical protein